MAGFCDKIPSHRKESVMKDLISRKGKLFVISGPSGTGKGTVCKRIKQDMHMDLSVSMTTREPRKGEVEGRDYFFVTEDEFLENIDQGNLLEHAEVYNHRYGTPRDAVMKKLAMNHNVLLEIDIQGGLQVKRSMPESVLIFLLPPSLKELRKRLSGRGTDAPEVVEERLSKALNEIKLLGEYDYCVVNDNLDDAVMKTESIIRAEGLRVPDKIMPVVRKYEEEE